MLTTRAKMNLIQRKEELSLPAVIEPYEIITLANSAWEEHLTG